MDKLPQRDDLIYKEIEEFQDYELTNCIAYEMAIRNEYIVNKIKLFNMFHYEDFKMGLTELKNKYYLGKEIIFGIKYLKREIRGLGLLKDIKDGIEKLLLFLQSKNLLMKFVNYDEYIKKEINELSLNELLEYKDFLYFHGYINDNKYDCSIFEELDLNVVPNEFFFNEKIDFINNPRIENNFYSRPYLIVPRNIDRSINLNLNLDLPKEELLAYISKIKDEYDKDNSIIKTPLELLGETLENENIDIKNLPKRDIKKIYADMFYIYDYFTFQDKKYKNEREKLKNKLKTKIKEINKTWDYDKLDKKEKIEPFSDDYKIDKQKYSKEKIIDELIKELEFKKTKVTDYLKIMRMFIDDLEYKKLLTGGLKLY